MKNFQILNCNSTGDALFVLEENNIIKTEFISIKNLIGISGGAFSLKKFNNISFNQLVIDQSESNLFGNIFLNLNNKIYMQNCLFKKIFSNLAGSIEMKINNKGKFINITLENSKGGVQSKGFFAFLQNNNKIFVFNCKFINISTKLSGVVISADRLNKIFMDNSFVFKTVTKISGGFIYLQTLNFLEIKAIILKENQASSKNSFGGNLYAFNQNKIIIENCEFNNSKSQKKAGAIYLGSENFLSLFKTQFFNSSAFNGDGGAFFFDINNIIIMLKIAFKNISSSKSIISKGAGSIFLGESNTVIINESTFKNILCEKKNGGVFLLEIGNILKVINSIFKEILAPKGIGGIFYIQISNIIYLHNNSYFYLKSIEGGFIFAISKNEIDIVMNIFHRIYSNYGGCFYLNEFNKVNLKGIIIKNIFVNYHGGLIYSKKNFNKTNIFILRNVNSININSFKGNLIFSETFDIFLLENVFCDLKTFNKTLIDLSYCKYLKIYKFNIRKLYSNYDDSSLIFKIIDTKFVQINYFNLSSVRCNKIFEVLRTNFFINNFNFIDNPKIIFDLILTQLIIKRSFFKSNSLNFFSIKLFQIYKSMIFISRTEFLSFILKNNSSIIKSINSKIILKRNIFLLNKALNQTSILNNIINEDFEFNVIIIRNRFISNSGVNSFGGVINSIGITKSKFYCYIFKNQFILNNGFYGGVLYFKNVNNVFIIDNSFSKNNAFQKGGTLYIEVNKGKNFFSSLQLVMNSFIKNIAFIGSTMFFKNKFFDKRKFLKNNYFESNLYIHYGKFLASDSYKIGFLISNKDKKIKTGNSLNFTNLVSGKIYQNCIGKIYGIDFYNQIMYKTDENLIKGLKYQEKDLNKIEKKNLTIYFQETLNDLNQNYYSFFLNSSGFICIQRILRKHLPLTTNFQLKIYKKNSLLLSNITLNFSFRACSFGESLTSKFSCEECLPSTYSFKKNINNFPHSCLNCFGQNFYCHGGSNLSPKPGYWRLNSNSKNFFKCPKVKLCKGSDRNHFNKSASVGICQKGSQGVVCSECKIGYGVSAQNICLECSSNIFVLNLILKCLAKFIIALYFIYIAFKMCISITKDQIDYDYVFANILIKIFNGYQEIIVIIFSLPIELSFDINNIKEIFSNFSVGIDRNIISLDCVPTKNVFNNMNNYYLEFFSLFTMPLAFIIGYIIFIKIIKLNIIVKKLKNNIFKTIKFKNLLLFFIIIIYWFNYINLIKVCFQMLASVNVGDDYYVDYRLTSKFSIRFFSNTHKKMILIAAIPVMVIFGMGYPLTIFLALKNIKNNNNMENPNNMLCLDLFILLMKKNFIIGI